MELRERLRNLRSTTAPSPGLFQKPAPLPYLIPLENTDGLTYYNDKIYIEYHGRVDLRNFPKISPEILRFLSFDQSIGELQIKDVLFLDIETTGTAGGAGTLAFLVGLGFVEDGYFQVRQFFLHDLAHESFFLHAIAEFAERFPYLVTYNGKCFDSQILKNRYLLHRRADPLAGKKHIDMLFIARRLWKRKFRDCDLMNLERNVLEFFRADDIPSYLIPGAYTDYLRFANASLIQKVIHHNQWDIVSLAVLMARACLLHEDLSELSAEEHFSLSLLHERHKNVGKAIEHQMYALRQRRSSVENRVLAALARNLRRVQNHEQMKWLLAQVELQLGDAELCKCLSIFCEHDLKDFDLALKFVQGEIQRLEKFRGIGRKNDQLLEEWRHRQQRLEKKIERRMDALM